jgi:hypothetical protein
MVKVLKNPEELPKGARPIGQPFVARHEYWDDGEREKGLYDAAIEMARGMGADAIVVGEIASDRVAQDCELLSLPVQAYKLKN